MGEVDNDDDDDVDDDNDDDDQFAAVVAEDAAAKFLSVTVVKTLSLSPSYFDVDVLLVTGLNFRVSVDNDDEGIFVTVFAVVVVVTVFVIIIVIEFDSKMIKESFLAISNFFSHVDDNGGTNDDDDDVNRDGDFGDDDGDDDENDDNDMFGLSPTSGGALEGHAAGKATIHPTISARCVCFKGG